MKTIKSVNLSAAIKGATHHQAAELTLAELSRAYALAHPTTSITRLSKWLEAIGDQPAWGITTEQIHAAAEAMLGAGYQPASVNRDVSQLGSLYKWARHKRYAPSGFTSPTLAIIRYTEAVRHIEVTSEELGNLRLMAKCKGPAFYAFVCLLIDTGARKSELLERRWQDFDLEARQITLRTTKTGKPRVLFYTPATATALAALKRAGDDRLVFEGRGMTIAEYRKPWVETVKAIGRPDLHMHDLRHAAAASLLRAGVTIGVAAQVLGHSSLILQRRYGHLENKALQDAQERRWGSAA
jgi:integrase